MEDEIKKSIVNYLASHRYMALSTIDPEGKPIVHSMGYASDAAVIYCATFRGTRKVQNIIRNSHVAFAVSEDYDDWGKIQGVQIQGKASFLESKEEIDNFGVKALDNLNIMIDCVIIAVAHDEFKKMTLERIKNFMNAKPVLIDIKGMFDPEDAERNGLYYRRI